jgi:hypothetical protein
VIAILICHSPSETFEHRNIFITYLYTCSISRLIPRNFEISAYPKAHRVYRDCRCRLEGATAVSLSIRNEGNRREQSPTVPELCLPPNGPPEPGGRHSDPCPPGHRSLCCASLGSAAPGGYCHTPRVGNRTSETPGGLPLAHTTLDRVGPIRVSKRRIPLLIGG